MSAQGGWFASLGHPVPPHRLKAALGLLRHAGRNVGEGAMVLQVVCREMEHDEPERAQRYLRSWIGSDETLVLRVLSLLCHDEGVDRGETHA